MFKRYIVLLISSFSLFLNALTLEELSEKLNSRKDDFGSFIQMKTLAGIGVTLVSTGTFEFKSDRYIKWTTLDPLKSEFTATQKEYTSTVNGKTVKRRLDEMKMSAGMKSLIKGNLDSLREVFTLSLNDRSITGYPKKNELKNFIERFVLEFDDDFRPVHFVMTFTNADVLDIVLKRPAK